MFAFHNHTIVSRCSLYLREFFSFVGFDRHFGHAMSYIGCSRNSSYICHSKEEKYIFIKITKKQIHILAVINYAPRFRPNQTTQPTISRPFNSNPFGNKRFKRIIKFNKF